MLQTCLQTFSKTCFKEKKSPDLSETCFRLVCNVSEMSKTCLTLFNQAQLGELTALPQTRWLDLRHLLVRGGRGGEGREGKGRRDGREAGEEREGRGEDRRVGEGRGKVRPWGNCAIAAGEIDAPGRTLPKVASSCKLSL